MTRCPKSYKSASECLNQVTLPALMLAFTFKIIFLAYFQDQNAKMQRKFEFSGLHITVYTGVKTSEHLSMAFQVAVSEVFQ